MVIFIFCVFKLKCDTCEIPVKGILAHTMLNKYPP
jgi:hypothetical protein